MEIRLLGPIELSFDGRPVAVGPPQQRAVLAMLALQVNRTVSTDRLIEGLWDERAPPSAHKLVQLYVSHLRKLLAGEEAEIVTRGRGYELRLAAERVDAVRFERLVTAAADSSDGEARQALALWRGAALADVADEPFASTEIRRLEELRLRAAELAVDADLAAGRHGELIGELEALIAADPLREQLHAQRMLALYRSGRQAEALEAYREVRELLVEQIGVEPGPELRRLHEAVLRQDAALEPLAAEPKGLPPELDPRTPLAGREADLDRLRENWRDADGGAGRVVLVTGARGIGKTRLIAELAGELHAAGARVVYVSGAASDAVAAAFGRARRATGPALLVFDDLDRAPAEIVRGAADLAAAPRVLVVLAYRDDPAVGRLARELQAQGAERLALRPLAANGVREIAELYAGQRAASAPVDQLLEASGGVPQRIHGLVADWVTRDTVERVGARAGRTAMRRGELRAVESELVSDVVELHAVREKAELHSPTRRRAGVPVCPFKGLASFEASDAEYFFGRDRLVAEMVGRLAGADLLGVVGPSGSGKSSAVRAGLLPAVASGVLPGSEAWERVLLRPGEHPLASLRGVLGADTISTAVTRLGPQRRLLLVVDQFEETFAACRDELERAAFMDVLADAAQRRDGTVAIVLALRADYYGACAAHPRLSRLLGESQVLVGPMQPSELAQTIEGPAGKAGLVVEPELAASLVADVAGQAGGLPLLSTALLELWQRREGERMRLVAYEQTGGVQGAVARLAEQAYARLTGDEQRAARRILLRLAGSGEGDAVVRRRVALGELEGARVLEVLAANRLVTVGEGTAEVAHEALLREWPRLRGWLDEDVDGRRLHRRVTDAARDWDGAGRDASELHRGARLASALDWAAEHGDELNRLEREFLEHSRLVSERDAERSRRTNRRLRTLLGAAALALAVAIAASVLALDQRGDARDAAQVADAQRLGAEAVSADRLENALLLARAGVELDESAATRSSLLTVLQRSPAQLGTLPGTAGWQLWAVAASPDGRLVAVGGEEGTVRVYDAARREPVGEPYRLRGGLANAVNALRFSPDGSTLAVAGGERIRDPLVVDLIDPRTGKRNERVVLPSYPYRNEFVVAPALEFLPGGRALVVQQNHYDSFDAPASMLTRVDYRTGAVEGRSLRVGRRGSQGLSATADGRRVFVTVPQENATYAIDPERLRVARRYPVGDVAGAVSPDGRLFALGSDEGRVRRLDLRSGRIRRFQGGHEAAVEDITFTPDGETVVSSDVAGNVIAWDAERGELRETFSGHSERSVGDLAVSADGRTLYSAGADSRAIVWDLAGDRRLIRPFDAGRPFATEDGDRYAVELALSPDGRTLARTHDSGDVDLIDTRTLRRRDSLRALRGFAAAVDFSADGRLLAVSGEGGQVTLWDARTLRSAGPELTGLRTTSQALAFSPDGELLAVGELGRPNKAVTAYRGGKVRLWDVRRRAPTGVDFAVGSLSVAFSPDGETLAAAGRGRPTQIRDARSGELIAQLRTADWGRSVAFSPDGSLVATGDWAGGAQLWSTETWKPVGRPLEGQEARILTLSFARDGRTLASASEDGTVALWDVDTRTQIGSPLTIQAQAWVSAAFTPGGSHLFAVSDRGRGVRFDVSLEAWKRHACRVAGREFSARELADALAGRPYRDVCPPG